MRFLRQLGALGLAILVFAASSSFFVDMHVCGGRVWHTAFLAKADPCPMASIMPPSMAGLSKNCCHDEQITHAAQGFQFHAPSFPVTKALVALYDLPAPDVVPGRMAFRPAHISWDYVDPPLRWADRTVDFQVFRI